MQSKPYRLHLYSSEQIKKMKQNSKKYHEVVKQFMTFFKVFRCKEESKHEINLCFFYHDQNDLRRNPYKNHEIIYSNFKNSVFRAQVNDRQHKNCESFFNNVELIYHPLSYKTNQCMKQGNCEAGLYCPYFHPEDIMHAEQGQFFRFDLKTFKTVKCQNKMKHERKTCLFFHNDKDKRRSSNIQYNHFICTKQKCDQETCEFSHNKLEQLYHPNRYKTKFCQNYPNFIDKCQYKHFCSFAHTQKEILQNIELIHLHQKSHNFHIFKFKTVWCPFTQNHSRDKCPYAHNIQDYRRSPNEYSYEPVKCKFWNFSDQIKSIEEAGCKFGMNCKKCHGWMELRYHPTKYNKKRSKSMRIQEIETTETIVNKKLNDINLPNKNRVKCSINPQIIKANYSKGTPFFKNDKHSQYSAKTKAKSNNIESEKSIDGSSNKDPSRTNESKFLRPISENIFAFAGEEGEQIVNWQSEWNKDQNSVRSKSAQKSQEYAATYSNSIENTFKDDQILKKLRKQKFNEIQIVNMDQNKIDKLSFLDTEQKIRLARKLQIYSMRQSNVVSYSKQLTKYFITKKKDQLLQKMQQKKVKQAKLLKLGQKQINQLSFLEAQQKAILPKLLKQYRSEKEFKELSMSIEEQTKMK